MSCVLCRGPGAALSLRSRTAVAFLAKGHPWRSYLSVAGIYAHFLKIFSYSAARLVGVISHCRGVLTTNYKYDPTSYGLSLDMNIYLNVQDRLTASIMTAESAPTVGACHYREHCMDRARRLDFG